MKRIRTRNFFRTLKVVSGFSACFLLWMLMLGRRLAVEHFDNVTVSVFAVFAMAAGSFLAFCFFPYFKGDRRWFSIPAMLTGVFFISLTVLWQIPTAGMAV